MLVQWRLRESVTCAQRSHKEPMKQPSVRWSDAFKVMNQWINSSLKPCHNCPLDTTGRMMMKFTREARPKVVVAMIYQSTSSLTDRCYVNFEIGRIIILHHCERGMCLSRRQDHIDCFLLPESECLQLCKIHARWADREGDIEIPKH